MSEVRLDLRGYSCPIPLLKTREALAAATAVAVIVDDRAAKENILRFAQSQGCQAQVAELDGDFHIRVTK